MKQRRKATILSLSRSKRVGILWNPLDEESIVTYDFLRKTLKERGISTVGLAHLNSGKVDKNLSLIAHSGFSGTRDISWSGMPKQGPGVQFIEEPFDILIDLSIRKMLALEYILVHSAARFKVGWESTGVNYYDLNIDITKQPNCRYLMEQIVIYLNKFDQQLVYNS